MLEAEAVGAELAVIEISRYRTIHSRFARTYRNSWVSDTVGATAVRAYGRRHSAPGLLASAIAGGGDGTGRNQVPSRPEPSTHTTNRDGNRLPSVPKHGRVRRIGTQSGSPAGRNVDAHDGAGRYGTGHRHGRRNHPRTSHFASRLIGGSDGTGRKQARLRDGTSTCPTERDATGRFIDTTDGTGRKQSPSRDGTSTRPTEPPAERPLSVPAHRQHRRYGTVHRHGR